MQNFTQTMQQNYGLLHEKDVKNTQKILILFQKTVTITNKRNVEAKYGESL